MKTNKKQLILFTKFLLFYGRSLREDQTAGPEGEEDRQEEENIRNGNIQQNQRRHVRNPLEISQTNPRKGCIRGIIQSS